MTLTNTETAEYPEDIRRKAYIVATDVLHTLAVNDVELIQAASLIDGAIAKAILAERQRCAVASAAAVMKFRSKVGGRYYPGYHEDMRDAVRKAVEA